MTTKLLIVESPGKIKKIKSFLPSDFAVSASVGHIRDLDKKSLSIDVEKKFKPTYAILSDKKKVVSELKKIATDKIVYLASDMDLEGEFISESIRDVLKLKTYHRITFTEITKEAINKAIQKPRQINNYMIQAQQTRRILDRLVGFKISPFLNQVYTHSSYLSAGRVQSVVVKLIVEHENKIKEFLEKDYDEKYECTGIFNNILNCKLLNSDIKTYDESMNLIKKLIKCSWELDKVENKQSFSYPTAPFTTSTLQQQASTKLGFNVKQTMQIAQKLYESGYITYMRTDCPTLSEEAHKDIYKHIEDNFGANYYQYKQYTSKTKNAQEAHEAIRPTKIYVTEVKDFDDNTRKLYDLIWKKTVSSQMSKAIFDVKNIYIRDTNKEYNMLGSIRKLVFDGYLKVYNDNDNDEEDLNVNFDENNLELNTLRIRQIIKEPPSRYNEASLVKKLEELGVGRPSTYASIISKIQDHGYVKVDNTKGLEKEMKEIIYDKKTQKIKEKVNKIHLGKENRKFVPTELGTKITGFLNAQFPQIMDYNFTSKLEDDLDLITDGKKDHYTVLQGFYDILMNQIKLYSDTHHISSNKLKKQNTTFDIGSHPNGCEIVFLTTKYGPAIKFVKDDKDTFISVADKPTLNEAIKLIDNYQTNVIKKIDKYEIRTGKYGPYILYNKKFYSIKDKEPNDITKEECDKIVKIKK
jgi:DNA topoisomerase-1